MTVKKFRSVESMPETWLDPGTAALFRAIRSVWDFGRRTAGLRFPPGVYRHRSMEEMNRLEEEWAAANFRAFRGSDHLKR